MILLAQSPEALRAVVICTSIEQGINYRVFEKLPPAQDLFYTEDY